MSKAKSKPHPLDDILSASVTPRGKARAVKERAERPPRASEVPRRGRRPAEAPASPAVTSAEDSWNATHERVTFHCPVAIRNLIYGDVAKRKKSLSPRERRAFGRTRVIVEILAEHYGVKLSS